MFGYVRPALDKLDTENRELYQAAYCGLCHTLGKRYGLAARLFLNYDLTFLAMLLGRKCSASKHRCVVHPIRKRPCACQSRALDIAADMSVILVWWQLRDGITDHGFWRGLKFRAALLLLRRAYSRACIYQSDFDRNARQQLERLNKLEQENCASVDRSADCFASLLSGAAAAEEDPIQRRILEQFLYHLGRWIYLADAADDLKKDLRTGSYNPIAMRYSHESGKLTEESRRKLGLTMDASIRQMAAAFELTDFGEYEPVIRSVVYEGLYLVGAAVLNGTFHIRQKRGQGDNP